MIKIIKKEPKKSKYDSESSQKENTKLSSKKRQEIIKENHILNFNSICTDMEQKGYKKTIETISIVKANILAIFTSLPFLILAMTLFYWSQSKKTMSSTLSFSFSLIEFLLFFIGLFASIFIHEWLHGFGWSLFCNYRWKSIEFGVIWKYLTPYCHCKEKLPPKEYLSGGLLPFMILGIGLNQIAVWSGSYLLLALSLINILAAGGDLAIALLLLKHLKKNTQIIDHPTECGFTAFSKE